MGRQGWVSHNRTISHRVFPCPRRGASSLIELAHPNPKPRLVASVQGPVVDDFLSAELASLPGTHRRALLHHFTQALKVNRTRANQQ